MIYNDVTCECGGWVLSAIWKFSEFERYSQMWDCSRYAQGNLCFKEKEA